MSKLFGDGEQVVEGRRYRTEFVFVCVIGGSPKVLTMAEFEGFKHMFGTECLANCGHWDMRLVEVKEHI